MTTVPRPSFITEVARINAADNALRAVWPHVCREHPVSEREAIMAIGTSHRADAIAAALSTQNKAKHDPFEGL